MDYEGRIFRPPSEAEAWILQATIGCSWNRCTYCDMYRDKRFRVRPLEEILGDVAAARRGFGDRVEKVFVKGSRFDDFVEAAEKVRAAALTLTVIPGTPLARLAESNRFALPDVRGLPRDRGRIVRAIEGALAGAVPLRPEWARGLS